MGKIKAVSGNGSMTEALGHNNRDFTAANIDPERTHKNFIRGGSTDDALGRFNSMLPEKRRSDSVLAVEVMMTATAGAVKKWGDYLTDCDNWAIEKLGGNKNILHIAHHYDETTPHTHIIFMPLKDGKLNSKFYIGGHRDRMIELQNDFYEKVGKKYKLDRGIPKEISRKEHTHHTLHERKNDLDDREAKLSGREKNIADREAKLNESLDTFKKIMHITPQEVSHMKTRLERFDSMTGGELIALGTTVKRYNCDSLEEYHKKISSGKSQGIKHQ
jgi:hypothetical protein